MSLLPVGQTLVVETGAVLTSAAVMLSVPQRVNAESADFYYNRGVKKYDLNEFSGAIADFSKAIELNPKGENAYIFRGVQKEI